MNMMMRKAAPNKSTMAMDSGEDEYIKAQKGLIDSDDVPPFCM